MTKNAVYTVNHGTQLEVLLNKYVHIIEFEPPPEDSEPITGVKRKLPDESNVNKSPKIEISDCPSSVKEAVEDSWHNMDNGELYVFTSKGVKASKKIAAFDMDGTLITPKSGKVYPVDTKDWKIVFPGISQKLKEQIEKGFKVVIFSNQSPIGKGRVKIEDFKIKIEKIVEKLEIPIQAFLATGKGFYRKPTTGMWKTLLEKVCSIQLIVAKLFTSIPPLLCLWI